MSLSSKPWKLKSQIFFLQFDNIIRCCPRAIVVLLWYVEILVFKKYSANTFITLFISAQFQTTVRLFWKLNHKICETKTLEGPSAHCVLLGPKYALKKTCLSCDASPFDESYESPGHNALQWQKIMVFYPEAWKERPKNFFLQRHLWAVPLGTN